MVRDRHQRPLVTFVTYEATRTGSPILLLRLLAWLRAHSDLDLEVLCWRGGPLVDELRAVADVVVLAPLGRRTPGELLATVTDEVGLRGLGRRLSAGRVALGRRGQHPPDLIYLNGAPSFVALPHLGGAPVLAHVHELEFALGRSLAPADRSLLGRADRYLAVAQVVADNLVERHRIAEGSVGVLHGFVDDDAPDVVDDPARLRARLGIPADAMVVGVVGDLIWRKGPDLFVQLAARVIGLTRAVGEPDPHFVWVGGRPGTGVHAEVCQDVQAMGLGGRLHLVGEQEHVAAWHAMFDVHAITSREEPFPLVMLEAARAGRPTVCFDAGGAPEFLAVPGDEAGVVVSDLDVAAMAEVVHDLLGDDVRRATLGRRGADRVRRHHLTSMLAPRVLAEIEALLAPVAETATP